MIIFPFSRPDGAVSIDEALTEQVSIRHNQYMEIVSARKKAEIAAAAEAAALAVAATKSKSASITSDAVGDNADADASAVSRNTSLWSMFF